MDIHIQSHPNPVESKVQNPIGFGFSPIHSQEYPSPRCPGAEASHYTGVRRPRACPRRPARGLDGSDGHAQREKLVVSDSPEAGAIGWLLGSLAKCPSPRPQPPAISIGFPGQRVYPFLSTPSPCDDALQNRRCPTAAPPVFILDSLFFLSKMPYSSLICTSQRFHARQADT